MRPFLIITAPLISAFVLFSDASAQKAYFNAGFGYGFPAGDRIGVSMPGNAPENVYGSFAKGLTIGLNTGYMASESIAFDMGIWYVAGSTYEFTGYDTSVGEIHDRVSGKTVRVMPSVKVFGAGKNRAYAKFGALLGLATTLNGDETYTLPPSAGSASVYSSFEYSGGTSVGWLGAFGINFSESQTTSIFIEANFCHQNFFPTLLTQSAPGYPKFTYKLVDDPNPAASDELLKPSFPFSTIGITAGVKFSSGGKKKNTPHAPAEK
jgi:hypothetical protein